MLIRIVKMTFKEEAIAIFLPFLNERKERIRHFPGCRHLELWQDKHHPAVYFTYSHWENEEALDHYRYSEFFKETWAFTKQHFAAKAEAYSIQQVVVER
jgi:heme-degrading monooxygenase HmoA